MTVPRRAECLAAIRAALEAGADVHATGFGKWTPLSLASLCNTDAAAVTAAVEALVAAGADVRSASIAGQEPLHFAVNNSNAQAAAAAARALLQAGKADALAKNSVGWRPLRDALRYETSEAAEVLLAAMPTDAALEDLCAAPTAMACRLLNAFVASRLPLTSAQWALIPAPFPGLGRALPAALAISVGQAHQVVRRLPAADAQRLRTFARCLACLQRRMPASRLKRHPLWPEHLPPGVVQRILSFFDCARKESLRIGGAAAQGCGTWAAVTQRPARTADVQGESPLAHRDASCSLKRTIARPWEIQAVQQTARAWVALCSTLLAGSWGELCLSAAARGESSAFTGGYLSSMSSDGELPPLHSSSSEDEELIDGPPGLVASDDDGEQQGAAAALRAAMAAAHPSSPPAAAAAADDVDVL